MAMVDLTSHDWATALAPLAGFHEAARRGAARRETTRRETAQDRREGTLQRLVTRYLAWRARRETVRMLHALDGATLRDLGITDIESQVYGAPEDRRRAYDPDWWRKTRVSR